ncbi:hypothetical protein M0R04_04365 [Candidatus Dojkabacteria bacterium]|jgi:hypothetical protein|nr:hypothetical protein [Candidatus Dojkabacteria bacterium]
MSREAGKGVKYIPKNISDDEYDKRWEMTFGKKKDLTEDQEDVKNIVVNIKSICNLNIKM